jgi:hypothetical protein
MSLIFPGKANKKEIFIINLATTSSTLEILAPKSDEFHETFKGAVDKLQLGQGPFRLHDWGGVISNAEEGNRTKLRAQDGADIVFSFTPWNDKGKKVLPEMIEFARSAGFVAMLIMTQKEGLGGKVDIFSHFRSATEGASITYYEDTYGVIKGCVSEHTTCYHVMSPEFPVEAAEKVPEVVDGSVEGYLELWQSSSVERAAPTTCSQAQIGGPPTAILSMDPSKLNAYLADHSYLGSEVCATLVDYQQYDILSSHPASSDLHPHVQRWRSHLERLLSTFGKFDYLGNSIPAGVPPKI